MGKKRILFGFSNVASFLDQTMCLLEETEKFEIRGLAINPSIYHSYRHSSWKLMNPYNKKRSLLNKVFYQFRLEYNLIRSILWCEELFLIYRIDGYSKFNLYLLILKLLKNKRKIFLEYVGSDIRFSERAKQLNPFYHNMVGDQRTDMSKKLSFSNQKLAKQLGVHFITSPEISLYLHPDYVSTYYNLFQRIDINKFPLVYPKVSNKKPLVLHTPSNPKTKGTKFIVQAVQSLKEKGFDFEYLEMTNSPREEVLKAMKRCDVFVDQLYVGGYGMASCEAMSMGKPVCVYIMPAACERFYKDLPLVNCNIDNIESNLKELIISADRRNEIGKKSRAFMEAHYEPRVMQKVLISLLEGSATELKNMNSLCYFK